MRSFFEPGNFGAGSRLVEPDAALPSRSRMRAIRSGNVMQLYPLQRGTIDEGGRPIQGVAKPVSAILAR